MIWPQIAISRKPQFPFQPEARTLNKLQFVYIVRGHFRKFISVFIENSVLFIIYFSIYFYMVAQTKNLHSMWKSWSPGFDPWVGKFPWRREWQPMPLFLPGEFHGQRSLAGYSP